MLEATRRGRETQDHGRETRLLSQLCLWPSSCPGWTDPISSLGLPSPLLKKTHTENLSPISSKMHKSAKWESWIRQRFISFFDNLINTQDFLPQKMHEAITYPSKGSVCSYSSHPQHSWIRRSPKLFHALKCSDFMILQTKTCPFQHLKSPYLSQRNKDKNGAVLLFPLNYPGHLLRVEPLGQRLPLSWYLFQWLQCSWMPYNA